MALVKQVKDAVGEDDTAGFFRVQNPFKRFHALDLAFKSSRRRAPGCHGSETCDFFGLQIHDMIMPAALAAVKDGPKQSQAAEAYGGQKEKGAQKERRRAAL